MYSPKIAEDLIPRIYRLAQAKGVPMTKVVDGILRKALDDAGDYSKDGRPDRARRKKIRRRLRALAIAKVLFEDEGYHTRFLEEIEAFLQGELYRDGKGVNL